MPETLSNFVKRLIIDTEAGYVFLGSKPVCYIKVPDEHPICPGSNSHQLDVNLRMGAHLWLLADVQTDRDDYVLKVTHAADGFEILCLNKQAFLKTVQKDISLFQYVLGPTITPMGLFSKVAKSSENFYQILHRDNALVGILLGFGTQNSIIEARTEKITSLLDDQPVFPYASFSPLPSSLLYEMYPYNVFFDPVIGEAPKSLESPGFECTSLEEEYLLLEKKSADQSQLLSKCVPRLIFNTTRHDFSNKKLVADYEQEQLLIATKLKEDNIAEIIAEKLAIANFNKPSYPYAEASEKSLANSLITIIRNRYLTSLDGIIEGIEDAENSSPDRYSEPDWDEFYKLLVFDRLQEKTQKVDDYFLNIANASTYEVIKPNKLFFQIKRLGRGNVLDSNHSTVICSLAIWPADYSADIPFYSQCNVSLDLNRVINGLRDAMIGMREGEVREIQIHPEEAYGLYTTFEKWQPLKIIVQLHQIDETSPLIKKTFIPNIERPIILNQSQKKLLNSLDRALSYKQGKIFWSFYRMLGNQIDKNSLVKELKITWPDAGDTINLLPIDLYSLKVWELQHLQEREKFTKLQHTLQEKELFLNGHLIKKLENKGSQPSQWPKIISLTVKDLDGNIQKNLEKYTLTREECERWNKGLWFGLNNTCKGDKGVLYIHPEAGELAMFRNPFYYKVLVVEFTIHQG